MCNFVEEPKYQHFLLGVLEAHLLLVRLLSLSGVGVFSPQRISELEGTHRLGKTLNTHQENAGHCVFCQKPSRISCFPSLRCNCTFGGQVFSVPGNLELSIPDFLKDDESYSVGFKKYTNVFYLFIFLKYHSL